MNVNQNTLEQKYIVNNFTLRMVETVIEVVRAHRMLIFGFDPGCFTGKRKIKTFQRTSVGWLRERERENKNL